MGIHEEFGMPFTHSHILLPGEKSFDFIRHSIANHHVVRICRSTPPSCWPRGQFQRFHDNRNMDGRLMDFFYEDKNRHSDRQVFGSISGGIVASKFVEQTFTIVTSTVVQYKGQRRKGREVIGGVFDRCSRYYVSNQCKQINNSIGGQIRMRKRRDGGAQDLAPQSLWGLFYQLRHPGPKKRRPGLSQLHIS
ncbi:putative dipeptidyl peptidase 3 [Fusarium oxysporum f. sp. albedinis]|nr:putative dipeptidyl peptidase 3 [Fusarium oxysporum f. sp. albedinis]